MFSHSRIAFRASFVVAVLLVVVAVVSFLAPSASAQSPTTGATPSATATASPATPAPPTATPVPTLKATPGLPPGLFPESAFQFGTIQKEVVVPLIGDDGRTHYVTLSEDRGGMVRIRLSLFSFPALTYNVVIFRRGNCAATDTYGPSDVIVQFPIEQGTQGVATLTLQFANTDRISIVGSGTNSIYDADGTSLAIYRPGSGGSGLKAACAVLAAPPGAPATGTGLRGDGRDRGFGPATVVLSLVALLGVAGVLFALRRRTS